MRAVLDTNVLVSLLLRSGGVGAWLLSLWAAGRYEVVISQVIMDELLEILDRPHIAPRIKTDRRLALLRRLRQRAVWTLGAINIAGATPDPDDDMLVSTAMEGEATFIVTWDKALLNFGQYQDIRFVTPQEFITILNQTPPNP